MKYKLLENFLSEEDNKSLIELALNIEEWKVSETFNGNEDIWRQSKCITLQRELCSVLMDKIEFLYPDLYKEFYGSSLKLDSTEIQLTRSHDGDFYKAHPDTSSEGYHATRRVTFVYYIHKSPKQFVNGNIRMYEDVDNPVPGRMYNMSKYIDFEPNNNTLLLFPSHQWHEVLPVKCFGDESGSRFTINGWMH